MLKTSRFRILSHYFSTQLTLCVMRVHTHTHRHTPKHPKYTQARVEPDSFCSRSIIRQHSSGGISVLRIQHIRRCINNTNANTRRISWLVWLAAARRPPDVPGIIWQVRNIRCLGSFKTTQRRNRFAFCICAIVLSVQNERTNECASSYL